RTNQPHGYGIDRIFEHCA
ncbi:ABC transporter family protein, partial [Vibrio parahaemolyticus VPTS-2010]